MRKRNKNKVGVIANTTHMKPLVNASLKDYELNKKKIEATYQT